MTQSMDTEHIGPSWIVWTPDGLVLIQDVTVNGKRTRYTSPQPIPGQIRIDPDGRTSEAVEVPTDHIPTAWGTGLPYPAARVNT